MFTAGMDVRAELALPYSTARRLRGKCLTLFVAAITISSVIITPSNLLCHTTTSRSLSADWQQQRSTAPFNSNIQQHPFQLTATTCDNQATSLFSASSQGLILYTLP
jgi:hypothetical protein